MKIVPVKFRAILSLSLLLSASASHAQEDVSSTSFDHRFSVVGLANFYTPSVDSTNTNFSSLTNSSKLGTGLGVLGEFALAGPFGVETGLIVLYRQNTYSSSIFKYSQSSNWLTVPAGVKFRFAKIFSLGAGPYLSYRVGDTTNDLSAGTAASISFDTSKQERFELGLFASATAVISVTNNLGLLIETRVLKGLSDLSGDSNTKIQSADIIALAGVQLMY